MHPDAGHLNQYFTPLITSYTDTVNFTNTLVHITPVAQDSLASITVNGVDVASGSLSQAIALPVGNTIINTVVTAPDGVTTKTFTLTMTRKAATPSPLNEAYQPESFQTISTPPLLNDDGILIHEAVSPNGDGINDFLQIDGISQYPENKLVIMNRSGQLIYEANGYDNTSKVFDGHSNKNGQMQLPGTYFYQLDYTVKGIIKHKTGYLVLKY
jgi:gliding motility-associated-like protein